MDREQQRLDEEEEAFIDLEDPDNRILDESAEPGSHDGSESEGDGDEHNAENANDGDEDGLDGEDGEGPEGGAYEDLNAVPDVEPERDDAYAVFEAKEKKALHSVSAHPTQAGTYAVAGESEEIYILDIPRPANTEGEADATASPAAVSAIHTLTGHTDTVSIVAFSPNAQWLAASSLDCTISLWQTSDYERVHTLSDLSGEIMTLLWHPSSLVLVAGADDTQLALWNAQRGTLAMSFVGHRGPVTCAVWTPDVKRLMSGSGDGTVIVYSPKTGEHELSITKDLSPDNAGVSALCFVGPDQFAVGCEDGTIHIASLTSGRVVFHLDEIHEQCIETLAVSDNKTMFISSSCDCKVAVWNVDNFSNRVTFDATHCVIPAQWLSGTYVILAGCGDGSVRVWDSRSEDEAPLVTVQGHRRMILSTAVDSERSTIATVSDDGTARFFPIAKELLTHALL